MLTLAASRDAASWKAGNIDDFTSDCERLYVSPECIVKYFLHVQETEGVTFDPADGTYLLVATRVH